MKENIASERARRVDLSRILNNPYAKEKKVTFDPKQVYDFELEKSKDIQLEGLLEKPVSPSSLLEAIMRTVGVVSSKP